MYKIIRHFQDSNNRTIKTGLMLDEAKAHCNDPETSSSTCTSSKKKAYTRKVGAWFDGYTECNK